jgi:cytochrome P450
VALATLLRRLPDLRLAGDSRDLRYRDTLVF